jgi:hypothetical protein
LRDIRNDLQTVDAPGRPYEAANQCRIPSGTCTQLEDRLPWLELQEIEHAKHEGWLRNRGGHMIVVIAKQNQRCVGIERFSRTGSNTRTETSHICYDALNV